MRERMAVEGSTRRNVKSRLHRDPWDHHGISDRSKIFRGLQARRLGGAGWQLAGRELAGSLEERASVDPLVERSTAVQVPTNVASKPATLPTALGPPLPASERWPGKSQAMDEDEDENEADLI
ncbi:hypothetical protein G7046_g9415 [Stylonectria norvegica]|nr:hypothetical protein G7046_g9415 [Stylonectria norvegica]